MDADDSLTIASLIDSVNSLCTYAAPPRRPSLPGPTILLLVFPYVSVKLSLWSIDTTPTRLEWTTLLVEQALQTFLDAAEDAHNFELYRLHPLWVSFCPRIHPESGDGQLRIRKIERPYIAELRGPLSEYLNLFYSRTHTVRTRDAKAVIAKTLREAPAVLTTADQQYITWGQAVLTYQVHQTNRPVTKQDLNAWLDVLKKDVLDVQEDRWSGLHMEVVGHNTGLPLLTLQVGIAVFGGPDPELGELEGVEDGNEGGNGTASDQVVEVT